jgi:hypothetical protein
LVGDASAADKSWIHPVGSFWSLGDRWSPNGAPLAGDVVHAGDSPFAHNDTIYVDQPATISGLELTDGMQVFTWGFPFLVQGDVLVSGHNGPDAALILIERGANVRDFDADHFVVEDGGAVILKDGAILEVDELLDIDGESALRGNGVINLKGNGARSMVLDGVLDPQTQGMLINQSGTGLIDLDGDSGNGSISLLTYDDQGTDRLTINGIALADDFGGEVRIAGGGYLEVNLVAGWTASTGSLIEMRGATNPGQSEIVELRGTPLTLQGTLSAIQQADARVQSATTLQASSYVVAGTNSKTRFMSATHVEGGEFQVNTGGQIVFQGPTLVAGGIFVTAGVEDGQGEVAFNGATEWAGNVTINGRARQNGHATVTVPTVIDATLFDMSGEGGHTVWDIEAPLVVNTRSTATDPFDFFEGVMNIKGAVVNALNINFDGSQQQVWIMDGELNLAGLPSLFVRRVNGSPVAIGGTLNLSGTKVEIASDVYFTSWATVNFASANSELRTRGYTYVGPADFNGAGTLRNGLGGEMRLDDGASLDEVGLVNQGVLRLAGFNEAPALASVDRFANDDLGTLQIRLGGYALGDEFDHLLVTNGEATLDGVLDVQLFDDGDGLFLPEIGDEFVILTSAGGVSGQFLNDPVSHAGGRDFRWSVLYHPFDVTLRLAEIDGVVPEPATVSLLTLAGIALRRRRVVRSQR